MKRSFALVAAGLFGLSLLQAAPAAATMAGSNGRLAYSAGRQAIYAVEPNGENRAELVTADEDWDTVVSDPSWSPDGSRLAFSYRLEGNFDIYVIDADGTDLVRLTDHPADDVHPTWSPSGARIAFASDRRKARSQIYLMTAAGEPLRKVTRGGAASPDWSPDGRRIAFMRQRGALYTIRPNGRGGKRLAVADGSGWSGAPTWAPGGRRLAYVDSVDKVALGAERVFVIRRNGTGKRLFVVPERCDDECYLTDPVWSPDGKELALVATREETLTSDLIVITLRTGAERAVATDDASSGLFAPAWQPQ